MSTPTSSPAIPRLLVRSNTNSGLVRPVSLPPPPNLEVKSPHASPSSNRSDTPTRGDTSSRDKADGTRLGDSRGIRIGGGGSGRILDPPVSERGRSNSSTMGTTPPRFDVSPRTTPKVSSGLSTSSSATLVGRSWPEGTLWINTVDKDLSGSLSAQERKRQEVIFELISTERRYVEDIAMILNVFSQPLQNLLKPPEHGMLFINMKDLLPVNQNFLKDLEDAQRDGNMVVEGVGAIIMKWSNQFKLYAAYCANSQNTKKNVDDLRQKNDKFAQYLENQLTRPECRGLNLEALLIKPVQRICKYPLLLKDLLKSTSETDNDYANIAEGLKSVQSLVDKINERTRRVDNAKRIDEIQVRLWLQLTGAIYFAKALEKHKDLDLQSDLNRMYIREGAARVSSGQKAKDVKDMYLFLFSDLLLFTKKSKEKYTVIKHVPALSIKVVDVPEWLTGISDTVELQFSNEMTETVQFDSKDLKSAWLTDLTKAIEGSLEKQQETAKMEASLQMARLEKQKAAAEPRVEVADNWRRSEPVATLQMTEMMGQVRELVEENKVLKAQVEQLQKDLAEERTKRAQQEEICQRWHS